MKTIAVTAFLLLLVVGGAQAFSQQPLSVVRESTTVASMGYIPDGFTAESYKKFKEDEAKKKATKNLGGLGPRGFKSRSMQAFQEAMERGEADHLLPVFNAQERIKKGEIKLEDVPYMQRGGSWDNSDVRGAKKKKWSARDKEYMPAPSASIFGFGEGLDWAGARNKKGPNSPENIPAGKPIFGANYKAPNIKDMKKSPDAEKSKKKLFGLF